MVLSLSWEKGGGAENRGVEGIPRIELRSLSPSGVES